MKIIKTYSLLLLGLFALCFVGCVGDDFEGTNYPGEAFEVGGTTINALNVSGDFDIGQADVKSAVYTVHVRGAAISGIEAIITHPSGASGSLGTSTSFPDTKSVSLNDALAATGMSIDQVEVADLWHVVYMLDGKDTGISFDINTVTTFDSALAGEMSAVVTLTDQGAGIGWDMCATDGQTWEGTVIYKRQQLLPDDDGEYIVYTLDANGSEIEEMSHGAFYPC